MSKALLVGDLHIPNSKSSISNSDTFQEIFNTFSLIKNTIEIEKPDYTIFFGDIFDSPYSITTPVISIISKIIYDMSLETSLIFIVGNHDDVDNKANNIKIGDSTLNIRSSLLSTFSYYPNVMVFDRPSVVHLDNTNIEIAFIPYSTNIIESLDSIKNKFAIGTTRIAMGHFDTKHGYNMIVKDDCDVSENIPTPEELIDKYKYDLVLLGHIHDPQEIKVRDKLVKYIGSCRNVDFRNTGENKGIYMMNFDDMSMRYIDNPHTYIYKVFRNFDIFSDYCTESTEEKLSRTKIQYIYSNSQETRDISKLKHFFKSVNFQKSMIDDSGLKSSNISADAFKEFESMINNNLITKEKLVDYALQFKEPVNKQNAVDILKIFNYHD